MTNIILQDCKLKHFCIMKCYVKDYQETGMKSNENLKNAVQDALQTQPEADTAQIEVAVKEGVVSLKGIVDYYGQKQSVECTVKKVAGVKAVIENIKVKVNIWNDPKDDTIAHQIKETFRWQWNIPEKQITVKVENGWVTLEGQVQWHYQKEAACAVVFNLAGVKGVSCNIKIVPENLKINIKAIEAAMWRSADIDETKIKVSASGNRVVLTGAVNTLYQKDEAAKIAWNFTGVAAVENQLVLEPLAVSKLRIE